MVETRAAPSHFDSASVELLFLQSGASAELTIDMSVVTYIDLPAIPLMLALIAGRASGQLATKLEVPRDERTLDYLEAWNFFGALQTWAHVSLTECLSTRSIGRLEDRRLGGHRNRYSGELIPKYSLPLSRISIDPDRPLHAAAREREWWLKGPIQNNLRAVIGKQASKFVARAVIFEGIKNTAMHSGAELVYTTAQVQPSPENHDVSEFAVCIWDSGLSIADTLRAGYKRYRRITTPLYGRVVEHFTIEVFERGHAAYAYELTNEDGAPPELDDELALFVSAFFFGVSADPTPRMDEELPDREIGEHLSILAGGAEVYGGFGTYLITDTIAYQCGGSVEYFNGPYHLTITTTGEPDRYKVKAEVSDLRARGVLGNLLVVRLPGVRGAPSMATTP